MSVTYNYIDRTSAKFSTDVESGYKEIVKRYLNEYYIFRMPRDSNSVRERMRSRILFGRARSGEG